MKIIHTQVYGSHLFGTNVEGSDKDYKQIHMNGIDTIIWKQDKLCFDQSTNKKGRNTSADIDFESKELRQFINDALTGQTYAIDMLFTPKYFWQESSEVWADIISNRDKLITNNVKPFIGYCTSQAAKYSKKGEKLQELMNFMEILKKRNPKNQLSNVITEEDLVGYKYFKIFIKELNQEKDIAYHPYLEGPDCSYPMDRSLAEVIPSIQNKIDVYGKRAQEALANGMVDLKAYYHAIRITWELEEYLTTRKVTLPCPKRDELLKIRLGEYTKSEIEELIESEIARVLEIPNTLPKPDMKFWDEWILKTYFKESIPFMQKYLEKHEKS